MSYFVFVDNSNVWIEGKYASAVFQKWVNDMYEAHNTNVIDNSWRIDFGKLLNLVTDNNPTDVKKALLLGSRPPHQDSFWNIVKNSGFNVETLDRNANNREKAIDTGIVQKIDKCLYCESKETDTFVLVAGDKDFIHSIRAIREEKRTARVVFWDNISAELKAEADEFIDLSQNLQAISYTS